MTTGTETNPPERPGPPGAEGKVYLRGLYGFRFLAALSVFYGHLEQAKGWAGLPLFRLKTTASLAADGVTCFFVLSGFLITYLLLSEERKTSSINLKSFYWRRLLRIWPLYYGWTLLVFFALPYAPFLSFPALGTALDGHFWPRFAWFVALCPQVAVSLYPHPPFGGPLWSVGVEECFYFTWPATLKSLSRKTLPYALGLAILGMPVLRHFIYHLAPERIYTLAAYCRVDCMAVGALFAWMRFEKNHWLEGMFRMNWIQAAAWALALKHAVWGGYYGSFTYTVYAFVYALLIVNVALNPSAFLTLEHPVLRFMGEISYGFYVYHWAVNVAVINLFLAAGFRNGAALFLCALALNTAISAASYFWFERRFLALRARFTGAVPGPAPLRPQAA
jgi:peptidoglycan/LPS O-acetylase OafA/YrhL